MRASRCRASSRRCSGRGGRRAREFEFRWREGRLECTLPGSSRSAPAVFERIGDDRYRTVSGRERGELLELVRDDGGRVVKLYWASYPFTREPHAF